MDWVLRWGDNAWREADLTGSHLMLIVQGLGEDTFDVSPTKGPAHLISVLAAFIAVSEGRSYHGVLVDVLAKPATELIAALTVEG